MTNDGIRQRRNILLCLSPSPSSIRVIRAASKLYDADRDTFSALYVGTAESEAGSGQLEKNIRFARECGAEIHIIGQGELTTEIFRSERAGVIIHSTLLSASTGMIRSSMRFVIRLTRMANRIVRHAAIR